MTHREFIGYLKGNAYKYIFRVGRKGKPKDYNIDIDKAIWYLEKLRTTMKDLSV